MQRRSPLDQKAIHIMRERQEFCQSVLRGDSHLVLLTFHLVCFLQTINVEFLEHTGNDRWSSLMAFINNR